MSRYNLNLRPDGYGNFRGQLTQEVSPQAKAALILLSLTAWILPLAVPFLLLWWFRNVKAFFVGIPLAYVLIVLTTLWTKIYDIFVGPTLEESEFIFFYLQMAYSMIFAGILIGILWLIWKGIRAVWQLVARL